MKLYYTPLSHFARKVRILIDAFKLDCEYINVGNVAVSDPKVFANNPLMAVPVLVDRDQWIIDSNYIAEYLVRNYNVSDEFKMLTSKPHELNVRAILDGVMANEVKIVIAKRTGVPVDEYSFFEKSRLAIGHGLGWLEKNAETFSDSILSYKEIHLICSLQHLEKYQLVNLKDYPRLLSVVGGWAADIRIAETDPKNIAAFKG